MRQDKGRDVVEKEVGEKKDEEEIANLSLSKKVVVKGKDWTIIPLENLLSRAGNIFVEIADLKDGQTAFAILEKGVDGVVFVADSQVERMDANIESLENLQTNLRDHGYELERIPYVMQYNKRDLPNAAPMDELKRILNPKSVVEFEAVATKGNGVFETLKAIAKLVLVELKKGAGVAH